MVTRSRRTCLTVPAWKPQLIEKAAELAADEVVLDLEDGTPADAKESARENLTLARVPGVLAIRINGLATPWWRDDLAAAIEAKPDVVVVPKAETADEVARVIELLPAGIGLEVLIETARGLVEVETIAAVGGPLEALVFGPGDFAASLGVPVLTIGAGTKELYGDRFRSSASRLRRGERLEPVPVSVFDYALARISVAAHAFGLQAVDGPYAALDDEEGLLASSRRALAHGFDGKWVVNPRQIGPVRAVFTPSGEQVERARRILAAEDGAVLLDGAMVDLASKRLAERVLARSAG
jgi:citrate lyase subunit beta/citryl-CoA lyase